MNTEKTEIESNYVLNIQRIFRTYLEPISIIVDGGGEASTHTQRTEALHCAMQKTTYT